VIPYAVHIQGLLGTDELDWCIPFEICVLRHGKCHGALYLSLKTLTNTLVFAIILVDTDKICNLHYTLLGALKAIS